MVTLEGNPSIASLISWKISKALSNRAERSKAREGNSARTVVQATVRVFLHLAGFACLTYAGFAFNFIAGMVVAGISCFILSTLITVSTPTNSDPTLR